MLPVRQPFLAAKQVAILGRKKIKKYHKLSSAQLGAKKQPALKKFEPSPNWEFRLASWLDSLEPHKIC